MNMRKIVAIAFMVLSVLIALFSVALGTMTMVNKSQAETLPVPQVRNFTLYVRSVQLKMPNGQNIYAFGYTDDPHGSAKIPGPTLVANEGDTVNVTLVNDQDPTKTQVNATGDGHTIHRIRTGSISWRSVVMVASLTRPTIRIRSTWHRESAMSFSSISIKWVGTCSMTTLSKIQPTMASRLGE